MKKKAYLDNLYYEVGKQGSNFQVAYTYQDKKGEQKWSKWIEYLKAQEDNKLIEKINNRTLLLSEVVIDLDLMPDETEAQLKKRYEDTIKRLKDDGYKFQAYFTGSKGYHIHLFFSNLASKDKNNRERFREILIEKYGGDMQKKIDKCMIALENTAHWKTGNPKELLEEIKGINSIDIDLILKEDSKQKETDELFNLLDEEDFSKQYLDQGQDKEGEWYFGFNLKGKEAIIRSNGELLRNTQERFKGQIIGENQILNALPNYEGYIGDIAPTILKATIKDFIQSKAVSPGELYKKIRDKILYYMDFSGKDEIADVMACWIMATYCYELFYWFPHILINAPSESGKSKCAYIIIQMSFRGFDLGTSGGVSPAQIFRTLEGNRGTILLDEFEMAKGNKADDSQRLINQILNASATKEAYVIRTEQIEKKWRAWKFPIYCPKIACNITGINPTSLSRFIGFKWLKTASEKGNRKPYREKDKQSFIPIREDIYILILQRWKEIKVIYDNLNIKGLINRDEDNWLPLFAIARMIDNNDKSVSAEKQLRKYIDDYKALNIETDDSNEEFFRILKEKVSEEKKFYTCKEIADFQEIQDILNWLKSPANWIGKRLKLFKFESKKTNKGMMYCLSQENVDNIIKLYYGTEKTSQTSQTSLSSQTSQTSQKSDDCDVCDVTPEVRVEEIIDISELIKEHDKGEGLSFEAIQELVKWPEDDLNKELSRLSKKGVIYEPKPDKWKVLA